MWCNVISQKSVNISEEYPALYLLENLFYYIMGGSRFLRKAGNDLYNYMSSQRRKQQSTLSTSCEPQIPYNTNVLLLTSFLKRSVHRVFYELGF